MKLFLCVVLVILVEATYSARIEHRSNDGGECKMKDVAEKIGCYNDAGGSSRPLAEELVNIRDPTSSVYVAALALDWTEWKQSLNGLLCECAKRAEEKNYQYIGVQFYGECWGGSGNYAKDGGASTCIQEYLTPCDVNDKDHPCAGEASTNYVYSVKAVYGPYR